MGEPNYFPREGGEGPKEFFHFLLGGKEFGTIKNNRLD